MHARPVRQRLEEVHLVQRHRLPLQPRRRRRRRRLRLPSIQPQDRRQRREVLARLVLQPSPLDSLRQRPPRQDAFLAVPEVLLEVEFLTVELAFVFLELHDHGGSDGAEFGVLLGLDALELLGLLLAQDVNARGVEALHAVAEVVLLFELLEVFLGDFPSWHAIRAAVAVGVHVP